VVVSLSPYAIGSEGGARFIVPPPAWLESIQDVPTPPGAPRAALALAARVVEPPSGAVDPAAFIATLARTLRLGGAWPESTAALVSARLRAVAESGRGRVVRFSDGASVAPAAGADGLLKQLADGGLWVDDDLEAALPRCRLFGPRPERFERLIAQAAAAGETPSVPEAGAWPFALVPFRDPIAAAAGPLPALGSKLYRESGLRPAAGRALVHPLTARAAGCGEGSEVRIETPRGVVAARLTLDPAIAGDEIHLVLEPCPERMGEKVPEAAGSRCALWEGAGEGPAAPLRARLQRI
jgi:anaerobic selenocysteine-containing dehydrogenase